MSVLVKGMKIKYTGLILALLCMCTTVEAARKKASSQYIHYLSFGAGAGYSGLLNAYDMTESGSHNFIGGGGGILTVGYQLQYKRFLFSLGPELRMFSSADKMMFNQGVYQQEYGMESDYPQVLHYDFSYNASSPPERIALKETTSVGQLMLPVLLGAQFEHVYFLAGAKVGYTLFAPSVQRGKLTTYITDEYAYDDWYNIGHGTGTQDYVAKHKNGFGFDCTLSAEVGIYLNAFLSDDWQEDNMKRTRPWHFKLALFADYGLPDMNIAQERAFADIASTGIQTHSLHTSEWAIGKRVNSLLVGVKLTALLQMNKPKARRELSPRLAIRVEDAKTGTALQGSKVLVYKDGRRRASKTTNKSGMAVHRLAMGEYNAKTYRNGYLPNEETMISHIGDLQDTVIIALQPEPYFTGYVRDAKTNTLLHGATVNFVDKSSGKLMHTGTTENGRLHVKLKPAGTYIAEVSMSNYIHTSEEVTGLGDTMTFHLQPIEKERAYVVENLFFASNDTTILPQSERALQELYEFLSENAILRIKIIGHTDNVGSDEDNIKLSQGRSESIKNEMIKRGIDASRIETEGRGEKEPVATNETEEGRQQNRRVEFVVL